MENIGRSNPQPPLGVTDDHDMHVIIKIINLSNSYPTVAPDGGEEKKKGSRRASTTKRGDSFIEGCIAALCCCWLCDLCCD